mgnify:CR=1 FL=1
MTVGIYKKIQSEDINSPISRHMLMSLILSEFIVTEKYKFTQLPIMNFDITYGELKKRNPEMAKNIDKPKELLLMSAGWLAREGHIILNKEGNDYKVSLRRQ